MPFTSKRQLQTCFAKEISANAKGREWTWHCEKWLQETPHPECLPTIKGSGNARRCRTMRPSEKIVGKIYEGPRGGKFFMAGGVKVYVPRGEKNEQYAIKKYGYVGAIPEK